MKAHTKQVQFLVFFAVSVVVVLFFGRYAERFTTPPINPPLNTEGFEAPTYGVPIYASNIPADVTLPEQMKFGPAGYFLITSTPSGPVTADTVITSIPISPTERITLTSPAKAHLYDSASGTVSPIPVPAPAIAPTPTTTPQPTTTTTPPTQQPVTVQSTPLTYSPGLPGMSPATSVQGSTKTESKENRVEHIYNMTIVYPDESKSAPSYIFPILVTLGVLGGAFIGYGIYASRR